MVDTDYGQQIKDKRERLHMTQKELADAIGLSKNGDRTIRRWRMANQNRLNQNSDRSWNSLRMRHLRILTRRTIGVSTYLPELAVLGLGSKRQAE